MFAAGKKNWRNDAMLALRENGVFSVFEASTNIDKKCDMCSFDQSSQSTVSKYSVQMIGGFVYFSRLTTLCIFSFNVNFIGDIRCENSNQRQIDDESEFLLLHDRKLLEHVV